MGCTKAVLRGKFRAIQAYLKKQEKSQINNLTLHLKVLEKESMTKEARIYNGEKAVSSISGAGKTAQLHVKE